MISIEKEKKSLRGLTFIDLFAGIGGIRMGFEDENTKCVFSSEWDKFAAMTYEANYGEKPYGDITKINEKELRKYLIKFKESANEQAKRKVVEAFVQEIRVYRDKIKIVLRKFPKDLDMVKIGGDDESRTRVRNHNDHKLLQV